MTVENAAVVVARVEATYNPVFARLVDDEADDAIVGMVAYALYKQAKREWVQDLGRDGRASVRPSEAELAAYAATWTPTQIEGKRREARQVLDDYAKDIIASARTQFLTEALRGRFWGDIWKGVLGNFVYTLLLIAGLVILAVIGVDLATPFQKLQALLRTS